MTEIIIDESQSGFLIKKFKEIFNPIVVIEDVETVLSFDNHVGKGTFRIITLERDVLNIYFEGRLIEKLQFKFFNAKQPVLNCIYLHKGSLGVSHANTESNLIKGLKQQLIYNSEVKEFEILTWPEGEYLEFNFLKLFDLTYLNSKKLKEQFEEGFFTGELLTPATKIETEKSSDLKDNEKLIDSQFVGKARMKDLECQVYKILNIQLKELLGKNKL